LKQDQSRDEERTSKQKESSRILTSALLDGSQKKWEEKTAQSAGRTNKSGKHADALREALRDELKDSSISMPSIPIVRNKSTTWPASWLLSLLQSAASGARPRV
jgi:hypothetical protein